MSERQTILVDMDGTFVQFDETAQAEFHDAYPHVAIPPRVNFYLKDDYPEEHRDNLKAIYNRPGFCADLPVYEGAFESWQQMLDEGLRPKFCSSPLALDPEQSKADKRLWIAKYMVPQFGPTVLDEAILTKHKHKSAGRKLIDDKPDIKHANEADWTQVVFDQPYNRELNKPRLKGWLDPSLVELLTS